MPVQDAFLLFPVDVAIFCITEGKEGDGLNVRGSFPGFSLFLPFTSASPIQLLSWGVRSLRTRWVCPLSPFKHFQGLFFQLFLPTSFNRFLSKQNQQILGVGWGIMAGGFCYTCLKGKKSRISEYKVRKLFRYICHLNSVWFPMRFLFLINTFYFLQNNFNFTENWADITESSHVPPLPTLWGFKWSIMETPRLQSCE